MPPTASNEANEPAESAAESSKMAGDKIDLKALAEKIYQLLKQEARLERERAGRRWP